MSVPESITVGPWRVDFRLATDFDAPFLAGVYFSTRTEELAAVPWSTGQKEAFLLQQFQAQDHAYRTHYPGAHFLILSVNGTDAGRLYVHPCPAELRIMDIALLPRFRNCGIGSAVLRLVLAQGARSGCRVTIHVEIFNPARRLYERLGFQPVAANQVYLLLEWRSNGA